MRLGILSHSPARWSGRDLVISNPSLATISKAYEAYFEKVVLCVPVLDYHKAVGGITEGRNGLLIYGLPGFKDGREFAEVVRSYVRYYKDFYACVDLSQIRVPHVATLLGERIAHRANHPHFLYVGGDTQAVRYTWNTGLRRVLRVPYTSLLDLLMSRACARSVVITAGDSLAEVVASRYRPSLVHAFLSTTHSSADLYEKPAGKGIELPLKVLFVGRLSAEKGLDVLVQAWCQLPKGTMHLTVVGEGPLRRELEIFASKHPENEIELVGWVHDRAVLDSIYRRADLLVLPSYSEGSPKVVLEAFARSVPVVGSSVGNMRALVGEEERGLLIPPGDPKALLEALLRIIQDPAAILLMGKRAFEFASCHTLEAEVSKTIRVLREGGLL